MPHIGEDDNFISVKDLREMYGSKSIEELAELDRSDISEIWQYACHPIFEYLSEQRDGGCVSMIAHWVGCYSLVPEITLAIMEDRENIIDPLFGGWDLMDHAERVVALSRFEYWQSAHRKALCPHS